ncbi:MAG: DUF4290 domain-containing protein [Bacteroides sp.]|nr:DUF4290 domain-containing protein [Bacteroides sp.]
MTEFNEQNFLPYNTDLDPVVLPEFGRTFQKMIDYCVSIPDREERNACAESIAVTMASMFPSLVGEGGDMTKVWDQINIISRFRLDVDFPCEVVSEETLNPVPDSIPYTASHIKFRHYGKNIEMMIERVAEMEDSPEKDSLISMIAHHMKKLMLIHNKEGVDDAKILRDLALYSNGKIDLDPEQYLLHEFKEIHVSSSGKKKRKKQ